MTPLSEATDVERGVAIRDLSVVYDTEQGERAAVSEVNLDLRPGELTGLVGESGSGKSTLALAMLNAVSKPGRISAGSVRLPDIEDVTKLKGKPLRRARGESLGYVFQASQNSLNPLKRIGSQLFDLGRSHGVTDRKELLKRASMLCERMSLDPKRVMASYQHELSGGMRQRVGIVFALVLNARVLILDEPTTALDMLTQSAVLDIVKEIHKERNLATLMITHDLAIVADIADRIAVMYAGRLVEQGPAAAVLAAPTHPYTRGLIAAMPRLTGDITAAKALPGRPPDLYSIPQTGCVFRERCPLAEPRCAELDPQTMDVSIGRHDEGARHLVACHVTAPAPLESTR